VIFIHNIEVNLMTAEKSIKEEFPIESVERGTEDLHDIVAKQFVRWVNNKKGKSIIQLKINS
jgi:hypothetical protein